MLQFFNIVKKNCHTNPGDIAPPHNTTELVTIHETLIKINDQEKSTILISTDTEELLKLSDRIAVIYKGKLCKYTKETYCL